jgi:hypothetical protein
MTLFRLLFGGILHDLFAILDYAKYGECLTEESAQNGIEEIYD